MSVLAEQRVCSAVSSARIATLFAQLPVTALPSGAQTPLSSCLWEGWVELDSACARWVQLLIRCIERGDEAKAAEVKKARYPLPLVSETNEKNLLAAITSEPGCLRPRVQCVSCQGRVWFVCLLGRAVLRCRAASLCVGLCCAHHTLALQSPWLFLLSHRALFPLIKIPALLLILPCLFAKICAAGNDESQGPHLVIPRPCGQPVALCCWRPDAVQLSSFISWSPL